MTNFEPFDLKRAEAGEPIQFRNCTDKVEFKCALHDADGNVRSLLFVHTSSNGFERELTRHSDGTSEGEGVYSNFDIVMKPNSPITKTFWACFDLNRNDEVRCGTVTMHPSLYTYTYAIPFEVALPPTKR